MKTLTAIILPFLLSGCTGTFVLGSIEQNEAVNKEYHMVADYDFKCIDYDSHRPFTTVFEVKEGTSFDVIDISGSSFRGKPLPKGSLLLPFKVKNRLTGNYKVFKTQGFAVYPNGKMMFDQGARIVRSHNLQADWFWATLPLKCTYDKSQPIFTMKKTTEE